MRRENSIQKKVNTRDLFCPAMIPYDEETLKDAKLTYGIEIFVHLMFTVYVLKTSDTELIISI